MNVAFNGIGADIGTFEVNGTVKPGQAVKIAGNGQVAACAADGDVPIGAALDVNHGYAAVQLGGYVRLPAASSLTVGCRLVVTDANGALKSGTAGRQALVVDVGNGVCGVIL